MSERPGAASTLPPWSEVIGPRGRIQAGILAVLVTWLYWDQLVRMVLLWTEDLDWSHGFLILPFSLYCLHTRRDKLARIDPRPNWLGLPLLLAGVGGYAFSIYARVGYSQQLSLVLVIGACVLMTGGWRLLSHALFPIFFLLLAIPPPDRLYRQFTQQLQQLAAWIAEQALGYLPDVSILRNGFSLTAVSDATGAVMATFTVAGACSGMRSLLAFMAIGLGMSYLTPRPLWQRVVMICVVFPVAVFCNVIRVLVTGVLMIYQYGDAAQGTPHMVLGLLTFGLGIAIYSCILYLFDHMYVDAPGPEKAGTESAA